MTSSAGAATTAEAVREFYNYGFSMVAGHFDCERDAAVAKMAPLLMKGAHVFDGGCGLGCNALWLAEQGFAVTAVDISTVAVERLQDFAEMDGLERLIAATHHDLAAGPLPGRFGGAVFARVLQHLDQEEIKSLLTATQEATLVGGLHAVSLYLARGGPAPITDMTRYLPADPKWLVDLYQQAGWSVHDDGYEEGLEGTDIRMYWVLFQRLR